MAVGRTHISTGTQIGASFCGVGFHRCFVILFNKQVMNMVLVTINENPCISASSKYIFLLGCVDSLTSGF